MTAILGVDSVGQSFTLSRRVPPSRLSKQLVPETLAADIPLSADHFRYFAGAARSEEGRISEIDEHTHAHHFQEPLGVVGQIIRCNFPLLMAAWKIAPALAAGKCTVIKPASPTPWSILKL